MFATLTLAPFACNANIPHDFAMSRVHWTRLARQGRAYAPNRNESRANAPFSYPSTTRSTVASRPAAP